MKALDGDWKGKVDELVDGKDQQINKLQNENIELQSKLDKAVQIG